MSNFKNLMSELESKMCPNCSGIGEIDDAELGDIGFNTYKCFPCKGTGFKNAQKLKLIETDKI